MERIGSRGLAALLGAALVACGGGDGGGGEATDRPEVRRAPAAGAAAARQAASIGADDPETTVPRVLRVSLRPDPPEPGERIRAVAEVQARGGYALSYVWSVAGQRIEEDRGAIELPRLRKGQTVGVRVVAANAAGESEPAAAEATVANTAPRLMNLELGEKLGSRGELEAWEAHTWARDPDGDSVELTYTWFLNDRPTAVDTAFYPVAELRRGDRVRVSVVASDGEDESEAAESGTLEVGNTAPEITSRPPRIDASGSFTYQIEATDADGDRNLDYALVEGPAGMQIHPYNGRLTWKPTPDQVGKHPVEIAVEDGHGGRSTQSFVLPVSARRVAGGPPAALSR